jgi:hypothetical protein
MMLIGSVVGDGGGDTGAGGGGLIVGNGGSNGSCTGRLSIRAVYLAYRGSPIFSIPASIARLFHLHRTRVLHIDRNDIEQWTLSTGWWVGGGSRGVDLFGRVSQPSPWAIAPSLIQLPPPWPRS